MDMESVQALTKDLRQGSRLMSDDEARYLVDAYYMMQEQRIRTNAQLKALADAGEPNAVIEWLAEQSKTLENQIKVSLDVYTHNHPVGSWMYGVKGIGPVLSAGLLAHIDITKAPTVGHIWRFAGLDPTVEWKKGQRRPWNARLKTLCWKIGESFVKTSGGEEPSYYGMVYKKRKEWENEQNGAGAYVEQAQQMLSRFKFRDDTKARAYYSGEWVYDPALNEDMALRLLIRMKEAVADYTKEGKTEWGRFMKKYKDDATYKSICETFDLKPKLPPAHIHRRACRYAVKLFISHLHHVYYLRVLKEEPPKPYAISILGHGHYLEPPNLGA